MTTEEMKAWIDQASYVDLLSKWRFAPPGDPFFSTPEVSEHYKAVMGAKKLIITAPTVPATNDAMAAITSAGPARPALASG